MRFLKLMLWLLLFYAALLVGSSNAHAVNQPDRKLDLVASYVAHHPITVWCEDDFATWLELLPTSDALNATGFTSLHEPVVYVGPQDCDVLLLAAHDFAADDLGYRGMARAIRTLVHESVHQRGIVDEGVTDCTALALMPNVARRFFGFRTKASVVRLMQWARYWHRASGPAYAGGCW